VAFVPRIRSGLSPIMVGRSGALARLVDLADAAAVDCGDEAIVVLVSGEPGIGKSRLIGEFAESVAGAARVIAVAAQPGSEGRPLELLAPLGVVGESSEQALVAALDNALAGGPVVLVIEDVHWADAASAHLIERLCGRQWSALLVVATYRPGDLSRRSAGGELVGRLERQFRCEQIRLDRLHRADIGSMITAITGEPATSAAVDIIERRSGGVPFVIEELLRCAPEGACSEQLADVQLPWTLEEAVAQQVAALGPIQRSVAESLAVHGEPITFELLRSVTDHSDGDLTDALAALVAAGVVVEQVEDRFALVHALTATSLQHGLLGRQRRQMHARFHDAMVATGSLDYAAQARHATGAGRFDAAVELARIGARSYLLHGSSFVALRLASDGLAEAPDDPELLSVAVDAAWRLEFDEEAIEYAQRWQQAVRSDIEFVDAWRFRARLAHDTGDDVAALAMLDELDRWAQSKPSAVRGRALGAIAQIRMITGDYDAAIAAAGEALAIAETGGDEWLRAQVLVEHASASSNQLGTAGLDGLLAAADLAATVGDPVLECRALCNTSGHLVPHSPQAADIKRRLRAAAARGGLDRISRSMLAVWETRDAFATGRQAEARRWLNHLQAMRPEPWSEVLGLEILLYSEEGRAADVRARLDRLHVETRPGKWHAISAAMRLYGAAGLGDPAAVREAWDRFAAAAADRSGAVTTSFLVDCALIAFTFGVPADSIGVVLPAAFGTHQDTPAIAAMFATLAGGDLREAATTITDVVADPSLEYPVRGLLRIVLAQTLLAAGDRAAALAAVSDAIAVDLAHWPGWRRDRAEQLHRRLQGHTGRSDGALTAREMEVAALIAEGLTNGQLAERLFISRKTAAVHVSNILMKLGLSSRAEIAAWTVRRSLDTAAS
jgi:DNA-binding CsgD family transcriptional regulator